VDRAEDGVGDLEHVAVDLDEAVAGRERSRVI
jgi:hypothetical protein